MVIFNYNCHVLTEKALTIDFKEIFDVGCRVRDFVTWTSAVGTCRIFYIFGTPQK
jgi:hypothetical protein